ncbi:hypothetical protein NKI15_02785 [Mesorhizobium sp. M0862]|uniref:hypothetical protein n=1 Tax=Mesorhizobium sp. M0862 TaxID=2957015 RepID=UPI00333CD501
MNQTVITIRQRLTKVVEQQQTLLAAFSAALLAGDLAEQGRVEPQLRRLSAEMQRLNEDLRYALADATMTPARPRPRASGKTMREQVLDITDEIGVPLAPSTVSEFSQATTGIEIPASRFASLRRDEERAARRDPTSRPAWVAPALSTARLTPIPRLLTSTAWDLERRVVGARSLRVIHLYTTLAFVDRLERLQAGGAPQASAIESLVVRYARGVPGAVASGQPLDGQKVRTVVQAELGAIEADDLQERRDAAARLRKYPEQQRLWGLPAVIEGGSQGGRVGG